MTVIKLNSISGINSITAKTNEAVAFYESDGSSGNVIAGVVTATNLVSNVTGNLSGDIVGTRTLGTGVTVTAAGIVSATQYYGSAEKLTSIPGANITGTIPTASLGNANLDSINSNIAILGFKVAVNGSLSKYNLVDQVVDEYQDASGIDAGSSTNEVLGGSGTVKYYSGGASSSTTYNQTYAYTGSDTTISLSNGDLVSGACKCFGAAGGQDSSSSGSNHYGGGGGFANSALNFTSDGTDLILSVGQGGIKGQKGGSAGNGGGYSGVFLGSKTHGNTLIIAGGGGGAGDAGDGHGGTGGGFGTAGQGGGGNPGQGGTQSAGGARGNGGGSVASTAGSALTGGHGGANEARQQSAAYNGGGIQGQEPGGYMGGGGGGGGYYGGGGGGGGTHGDGGGGGSSYYKSSGSYFSGTPSSAGGSTYLSGGKDDANYTAGVGLAGHTTSEINGGNGAIYLNVTVTTTSAGNLTLQSVANTASTAPTKADLVLLIENSSGTATLNTDIKGYISRDGTNFTQGTLVDEGTWGTNKKIVSFHNLDISGQSSGTSMKYKITTHNQSAGSKETRIHATSLGWS